MRLRIKRQPLRLRILLVMLICGRTRNGDFVVPVNGGPALLFNHSWVMN